MHCYSKIANSRNEKFSALAVLYVSVLSDISLTHEKFKDLLDEYRFRHSDSEGSTEENRHNLLTASVEVVTESGAIERLYFAVPHFVKKFWPYPEVRKAVEESVYSVNRNSPEGT